jgi:hypothetical protein
MSQLSLGEGWGAWKLLLGVDEQLSFTSNLVKAAHVLAFAPLCV